MIDISMPLDGSLPIWPGSIGARVSPLQTLASGDANVSRLDLDVHTGTHVDAPLHVFADGAPVDAMKLDAMIGPAEVIDCGGALIIDVLSLMAAEIPPGARRVLLRTVNSTDRSRRIAPFHEDFAALTADAASWLVAHGVQLVGIDYLSVQRYGDSQATHRILLDAGVAILEGLDLGDAPPGSYELICLPIRLVDVEAAPARAVLRPITR